MRRYVEATWPNDPVAQQHYYEINRCDTSNTRILQIDGKDIGRLSTTLTTDCILIDELHILPEYQRRAIGEQVIYQILNKAREKGLSVRLAVLKLNPAQNLYRRMGFKVIVEKDHRLHMEAMPWF